MSKQISNTVKNKKERPKRIYLCPFLDNCKLYGTFRAKLDLHLLVCCESFTDQTSYKVRVPNTKSYQKNMVLAHFNNIFLLQLISNIKSGKFWCGVRYIGKAKNAEDLFYSVSFTNRNTEEKVLKYGEIQLDSNWKSGKNAMLEFDLNIVKFNEDSFDIRFRVHRYSREEVMKINKRALRNDLVCMICLKNNIISQPVFLCFAGHVTCNSCYKVNSKRRTCPFGCNNEQCNLRFGQITSGLQNFCSNREYGCYVIGNKKEIQKHKLVCPIVACLVAKPSECKWKGLSTDFQKHLLQNHSKSLVKNNEIIRYELNRAPYVLTTFLSCDENVFKIYCQVDHREGIMKWICYSVDFENTKLHKLSIRFTYLNQSDSDELELIQKQMKVKEFIKIPLEALKPFVDNNIIAFSYSVSKC